MAKRSPKMKPLPAQPIIVPAPQPQIEFPKPDPKWSCAACACYFISTTSCIKGPPAAFWNGKFDEKGNPIVATSFPQMNPWGKCFAFEPRDSNPLGNAFEFPNAPKPETKS